jgi:HNH endonuclease
MKEIKLLRGELAQVDDDVYDELNKYSWYLNKGSVTNSYMGQKFYMHHEIIGKPPPGLIVDHIDGNVLNNQRNNLRFVSYAVNRQNQHKPPVSSSGFFGVSWYPTRRKNPFKATIIHNKKSIYLGWYSTAVEAATVYDRKAKELYGTYANTNFPS